MRRTLCTLFWLMMTLAVAAAKESPPVCDQDDGGLTLLDGFCARVVADELGRARHLTVRDNGDLYVALRRPEKGGAIVALRDADGDGRFETQRRFGEHGGTEVLIHAGHLYFGAPDAVLRYRLEEGKLLPTGEPETVVHGFPAQRQHAAKTFAIDGTGQLYVNVGAPSNACQKSSRTPGSPGLDPCPQLERQAGIWRFDAGRTGQTQQQKGKRFATGIRNAVAIAWNPVADRLYVAQHGRDQLMQLWPKLYNAKQSAELPAEELLLVDEGDDFGWPYCYYDGELERKVLAPEYGGDGEKVGRCAKAEAPVAAFPGHWAPNDLLFYTGSQFPESYRGGAFIAFHGSWNRAPLPQRGYKVVFVPFFGARPAGDHTVFADGFAGPGVIESTADARHRPMGLAQGPDGSLYIADSVKGRIWQILYRGGGQGGD